MCVHLWIPLSFLPVCLTACLAPIFTVCLWFSLLFYVCVYVFVSNFFPVFLLLLFKGLSAHLPPWNRMRRGAQLESASSWTLAIINQSIHLVINQSTNQWTCKSPPHYTDQSIKLPQSITQVTEVCPQLISDSKEQCQCLVVLSVVLPVYWNFRHLCTLFWILYDYNADRFLNTILSFMICEMLYVYEKAMRPALLTVLHSVLLSEGETQNKGC